MATEFNAAGYQDLRDYIEANWKYIEIRKSTGEAILRKSTSDPRVSWKHEAGAQELILEIALSGSDAEITLPVTIDKSAIYKVATGGSALSEDTFTAVTLEDALDKITIQHKLQAPRIV